MHSYVQLLLCFVMLGQTLANSCTDSEKYVIDAKIQMTCNTLPIVGSKSLYRLCEKNKLRLRTHCCKTCLEEEFKPPKGAKCENNPKFTLKKKLTVNCTSYAALDAVAMRESCNRDVKNIATGCCVTCAKVNPECAQLPTPAPVTLPPTTKDGKCVKTFPRLGNGGGTPFNDQRLFSEHGAITKFLVRAGRNIVCFGFAYGNEEVCHGGTWAGLVEVEMQQGEFVTGISGRFGLFADQLTVTTNLRKFGPYGGTGGTPFDYSNNGAKVAYISGVASGSFLEQLSVHFIC